MGVHKLTSTSIKIDGPAAGNVNSFKNGCKLLNPDHEGNIKVQIIVIDVPVIIDATAPSFVALFHKKAAIKEGVIAVPYILYAV